MTERERAEERVAEFLAAREGGHRGTLADWLVDEPPEFCALARAVALELEQVLGALALGPLESRPPESEPSELGPSELGPSELGPSEPGPSEFGPSGSRSADSGPSELATPGPGSAGAPDHARGLGGGWHYTLGPELGRGGNGTVLEAFDASLGRRLAMKILSPEPDPVRAARRRARFRAEARLAGRLQHPGVVAVHELGSTPEGDDYFTMPKVEGATLAELIRRAHAGDAEWSRTRLLDVLVRVAETMAFAHARAVVHRDLKPANVMVGAFGETYVLDWGLARAVGARAGEGDAHSASEPAPEPARADLTGRGDVIGTPAYMPPEQAGVGDRAIGVTADVYALGACLHEVLTGEPPFGRGTDSFEVLRRLALEGPPALDPSRHRVPSELAAIRARAMAADPADRYADAGGFARDLRAYLEGRVVSAYESGGWAELRKWIGRNRGLAAALAGTLLAVVGGVALAVWWRAEERAAGLRFLDLQLVDEASESALGLWPATTAADAPRLAAWLAEADALLARGDRHRAELAVLEREAAARRERRRGVDDPRWTFADRDARWRHEKLDELVRALDAFAAEGGPRSRVAAGLERITGLWPAALVKQRAAWERLREDWRASPRYASPPPEPLPGLVPLGIDPASGLAEFALVGSGTIPPGPGVAPEPEHAVVLAAVPGGRFEYGVAPDADGFLLGNEHPPRTLELEPFLLGRFELSRAQLARLVRGAPPGARSALVPATGLTWREADQALREWGLCLPTEARWERAAELGWGFDERPQAAEAERFEFARAALQPLSPVGARPRDGAGFGDLLGNLSEFCLDPVFGGALEFAPGDGLARSADGLAAVPDRRHARGGHFGLVAPELPVQTIAFARPEFRLIADVNERGERYGVRVARDLR